jgi:hypothetical protein
VYDDCPSPSVILIKNQVNKITQGVVCMNLNIYIKNLFLEQNDLK